MDYFISLSHVTVSLLCLTLVKEKLNTLQLAHSLLTVREKFSCIGLAFNKCGIVIRHRSKKQLKFSLTEENLALP